MYGRVEDIIVQGGQKVLILDTDWNFIQSVRGEWQVRLIIPSEIFNGRIDEFLDRPDWEKRGGFIVKIQSAFSSRTLNTYVSSYRITDSGELEDPITDTYYDHEATLFVCGELIDFYMDEYD
jgi:hypothetical protein